MTNEKKDTTLKLFEGAKAATEMDYAELKSIVRAAEKKIASMEEKIAAIKKAINERSKKAQEIEAAKQELEKQKIEAETKRVQAEAEAKANKIISDSITEELLKQMEMEARLKHGWIEIQGANTVVDR